MTVNLANEKLMSVLIGPHLSEKSSRVAERVRQFVFKVRRDADKKQVKRAVELMFGVKVTAVQVTPSNGPSDWQEDYAGLTARSRRIAAEPAE